MGILLVDRNWNIVTFVNFLVRDVNLMCLAIATLAKANMS